MRSKQVCVLSGGEAEALRNGERIYCYQHEHITQEDAFGLTAPIYMQRDGGASKPVAEWVGPKHIRYLLQFTWKNLHQYLQPHPSGRGKECIRMKTRQLVAGFQ